MTSVTDSTRATVIKERLAAAPQYPSTERRKVVIRGQELMLPTIKLPVDLVLLNHNSHRIKAEVESLPADEASQIRDDPFSDEAQRKIEELIRNTAGFKELRAVMSNEPQREPGMVTADGVLINANTRTVALRDLKRDTIDVLVLPKDLGPRELLDLEFRLQMQRESKQPYSFTAQLLFIEDLLSAGWQSADIGALIEPSLNPKLPADKKKAAELVDQEIRLLALVRQVVAGSAGKVSLTWFDENRRQALIEIDADYQAMVGKDPAEAVRIRSAQLAAMLSGHGYSNLRRVDGALLDDYLPQALKDQPAIADHVDALLNPDGATDADGDPEGLGLLLGDDETPSGAGSTSRSAERVYQLLVTSGEDDLVTLPGTEDTPGKQVEREVLRAAFQRAVEVAIDNQKRDTQKTNELTAPIEHLAEAKTSVDKAKKAHHTVLGIDPKNPKQRSLSEIVLPRGYDIGKVREAIAAARRALDDLEAELPAASEQP